ncbi:high-potential iron-sulfur protein [Cupriavidus basilensis]|uniref:high-potential iron-sulfur protein n=1 Tax=Cupriavidus basilensis TaxID=68895 RepID=UPI0039F73610
MLHYQESPKDGQSCSDCSSFRPSTAPDSDTGTCKILEGPISLHGWCMAFSRR